MLIKKEKSRMFNRDQRRRTRDLISRAIKKSKAYIVILWEGAENDPPLAVIDIKCLSGKETPVAKAMGRMAQHTAAAMHACQDLLAMTAAQREQAERVAAAKDQRSADLSPLAQEEEAREEDHVKIMEGDIPAAKVAGEMVLQCTCREFPVLQQDVADCYNNIAANRYCCEKCKTAGTQAKTKGLAAVSWNKKRRESSQPCDESHIRQGENGIVGERNDTLPACDL
jgi:hypothetical protein